MFQSLSRLALDASPILPMRETSAMPTVREVNLIVQALRPIPQTFQESGDGQIHRLMPHQ